MVGSSGNPETTVSAPPWRLSTRRHSPSGSAEIGSRASAGTTYHEPSSISSSSWVESHPAYPENRRAPMIESATTDGSDDRSMVPTGLSASTSSLQPDRPRAASKE